MISRQPTMNISALLRVVIAILICQAMGTPAPIMIMVCLIAYIPWLIWGVPLVAACSIPFLIIGWLL